MKKKLYQSCSISVSNYEKIAYDNIKISSVDELEKLFTLLKQLSETDVNLKFYPWL